MSQNRGSGGVSNKHDFDPDPDAQEEPEVEESAQPHKDPEDRNKTPLRETPQVTVKAAEGEQSCVMLGPSRSGKTTLLTAIKRACDQPADDDLNLEFIPGKDTAKKIKDAIHFIVERQPGHEATKNVGTYPFEVHVSAKPRNFWSPPLEADLHVVMSDGGGGFLLPAVETLPDDNLAETSREQLIQTALKATSMILCVDVTSPGITVLEKELAISFAEMSKSVQVYSAVHWTTKLWAWLHRQPIPPGRARWKKSLNVNRFLLLLTQVDKLCHRLPASIVKPIRFAEMIDPVEQARDLLGIPVLKTIRNALKPDATFAVGVISAMGFHPRTGDPFADVDGTPLNLIAEADEDILRRWTPFGIRDVIYFLATGKCRGTVKELHENDLKPGAEPLEFTYSAKSCKET